MSDPAADTTTAEAEKPEVEKPAADATPAAAASPTPAKTPAPASKTPPPASKTPPPASKTPPPASKTPEPDKDEPAKEDDEKGDDSARKSPAAQEKSSPRPPAGADTTPSYMAKLGLDSARSGGDSYRSAEEILQKYRSKWSQEARLSPRGMPPPRSERSEWGAPYHSMPPPRAFGGGTFPRSRPSGGRGPDPYAVSPRLPERGYSTYQARPLPAPLPTYRPGPQPTYRPGPGPISPGRGPSPPSAFTVATTLSDQLKRENELLKQQVMAQEKEISVLRQEVDNSRQQSPIPMYPEMMAFGKPGGASFFPDQRPMVNAGCRPDPVVMKAKTMLRDMDQKFDLPKPIPISPRPVPMYSRGGGGNVRKENIMPSPTSKFRPLSPQREQFEDKLIGRYRSSPIPRDDEFTRDAKPSYGSLDRSLLENMRPPRTHPMISEIKERRKRRENPDAAPPRRRPLPPNRPPPPREQLEAGRWTPPPKRAQYDSDMEAYREKTMQSPPPTTRMQYDSDSELYRGPLSPPKQYDSDSELYPKTPRNNDNPRPSGRVQMFRAGSPICDVACQAQTAVDRGIGPNGYSGDYRPPYSRTPPPREREDYPRDAGYPPYGSPPQRERHREMSPRRPQPARPAAEKPRGGVSLDDFHWKTRELLERQRQISERIMQQFEQLDLMAGSPEREQPMKERPRGRAEPYEWGMEPEERDMGLWGPPPPPQNPRGGGYDDYERERGFEPLSLEAERQQRSYNSGGESLRQVRQLIGMDKA